jgi:prophage regulatory protein
MQRKRKTNIPAYISDDQLASRFSVTRQTIWAWVKSSNFPPPLKLSKGTSRWLLSAVKNWEQSRGGAE